MSPSYMDELCISPYALHVLGEIITKLHLSPNITLTGLTLENQIAWKTVSEIIKLKHFTKMYM